MAGKVGGVSLYIAEKLAYTEPPELDIVDDCIGCVFARVHVNGQAYIVGVVYRPPNSNVMDFNSTMHDILKKGDPISLLHYGWLQSWPP